MSPLQSSAVVCDPCTLLLAAADGAEKAPQVQSPAGLLAILLGVLALIFWASQSRVFGPIFKVIPALVFCYFIPTTLTSLGVIPNSCAFYTWVKTFVLPASLLLLILSLDLPAIIRLGWRPVVMLLAGTAGVVIGGPIALILSKVILIGEGWKLPADGWRGLAALSGSWIGGGANFVALGDMYDCSERMLALMVIPDVLVANIWMGVLLFLATRQHEIDRRTGADTTAIRMLEQRLSDFQARVARIPSLADLLIILALGFGASWICFEGAHALGNDARACVRTVAAEAGVTSYTTHPGAPDERVIPFDDMKPNHLGRALDKLLEEDPTALNGLSTVGRLHYHFARFVNEDTGEAMWKYVFVTTLGLILSFTRVRNLEGAGASKLGSVMLYLLVACIGAHANFRDIVRAPGFVVVGFIWMACHVGVLLLVARLIKAPIFFVAVGSQANIGGAASAPIVASAYHPSLAPVGVLLAVAGYVLGTYAGAICGWLLQWAAG